MSNDDDWIYKGIVYIGNKYGYLRVILTTKLSWNAHLKDKHVSAKLLINSL